MRMAGIYTGPVTTPTHHPIGPYDRGPVSVRPWNPRVVEVAARVVALIEARRPDLHVEHIGSTAVPGLAGKGIVDLGTEADPADIPAITDAMYELGFGPQPGPDAWPPTRPMHVGSYRLDGEDFLIHFHVHPRGGDLHRDVSFRDALRADPGLAAGYAQAKDRIVASAGGRPDRVAYQDAKGDWIVEAFDRLGISRSDGPGEPAQDHRS
jgi:GrpB-like predicted nucleotidyltransferase (UPF0157 family)